MARKKVHAPNESKEDVAKADEKATAENVTMKKKGISVGSSRVLRSRSASIADDKVKGGTPVGVHEKAMEVGKEAEGNKPVVKRKPKATTKADDTERTENLTTGKEKDNLIGSSKVLRRRNATNADDKLKGKKPMEADKKAHGKKAKEVGKEAEGNKPVVKRKPKEVTKADDTETTEDLTTEKEKDNLIGSSRVLRNRNATNAGDKVKGKKPMGVDTKANGKKTKDVKKEARGKKAKKIGKEAEGNKPVVKCKPKEVIKVDDTETTGNSTTEKEKDNSIGSRRVLRNLNASNADDKVKGKKPMEFAKKTEGKKPMLKKGNLTIDDKAGKRKITSKEVETPLKRRKTGESQKEKRIFGGSGRVLRSHSGSKTDEIPNENKRMNDSVGNVTAEGKNSDAGGTTDVTGNSLMIEEGKPVTSNDRKQKGIMSVKKEAAGDEKGHGKSKNGGCQDNMQARRNPRREVRSKLEIKK